jgi:hypothetical protein
MDIMEGNGGLHDVVEASRRRGKRGGSKRSLVFPVPGCRDPLLLLLVTGTGAGAGAVGRGQSAASSQATCYNYNYNCKLQSC